MRFRECGLKACALECVATRGALLIAATSQKPRSLRCERSIKIPKRLQAPISSLPRSVRPGPCRAMRDNGTARHARTHWVGSKRARESEVPPHTIRPGARNSGRLLPRLRYEERVLTHRPSGLVECQ